MGRENSAGIRQILDAQTARDIYDFAVITLPTLPGETNPTILKVATANIHVDSVEFTPTLKQVGGISFSLGTAPNQTSITFNNMRRQYGALMMNPVRTLDNASIIVYRGFKTGVPGGGYEADQIFEGSLRDAKLDGDEVKCNLIADISRRNSKVGNLKITQRCRKVYSNLNGIYRPNSACGWLLEMGVDLNRFPNASTTSCDLTPDGPNGCKAHRNRHRFGGVVETLPPNSVISATGGTVIGGGYGGCFLAGEPVLLADFETEIPINFIDDKSVVASMDYNKPRELVRHGKVGNIFERMVEGYFELKLYDRFENEHFKIRATREQPAYIGKKEFAEVSQLLDSNTLYRLNKKTKRFHKIYIEDKIWIPQRVPVYNMSVPTWENYMINRVAFHNQKQATNQSFVFDSDYWINSLQK